MSDAFGYAYQQPQDFGSDLGPVLFACQQLIVQLDFVKLVKVVAVHAGTGSPPTVGTVDVQILVSQIDFQGYPKPNGIVYGLPVWRFQFGPWAIVADPAVGDYGYVICADRDSSLVVKSPGQQNAGSWRQYSVSDGIYVGGCLNPVPASWIWLKSDGTISAQDSKGNTLASSSSGWAMGGNLAVTGTITASSGITAGFGGSDSVTLQHHTHPSNGSPPTPGT